MPILILINVQYSRNVVAPQRGRMIEITLYQVLLFKIIPPHRNSLPLLGNLFNYKISVVYKILW